MVIIDFFLADQKASGEVLGKPNNHEITETCELQPGFYKVARNRQCSASLNGLKNKEKIGGLVPAKVEFGPIKKARAVPILIGTTRANQKPTTTVNSVQ
jgi:hypothetical protein